MIAERGQHLDKLHYYLLQKQFPRNTYHPGRRPYFIDIYNTPCAVGYLIIQSGNEALARTIARDDNYAYIRELKQPALAQWQKRSGFTINELALIQPSYWEDYQKPEPRCGEGRLPYGGMGENLSLRFKGECVNNKLNGKWQLWHHNEKLWEEGEFKEGLRAGEWRTYDINGNIEEKGNYVNDLREGAWSVYRNNKLIGKSEYHKGLKHGKTEQFSEKGIKVSELNYVNDQPHGYGIAWHATDKPMLHKAWEGYYKSGKQDSLWRQWDLQGNLTSSGYYVNGYKEGIWSEWYGGDEAGLLQSKGEYRKGIREGTHERYLYREKNAKKVLYSIEYTPYKNGKKNGTVTNILANGIKTYESYYVNDTMESRSSRWYESGQAETIGYWKKGKMDGTWHFYYPDGKLKMKYIINEGFQSEHIEWDSTGVMTMKKVQSKDYSSVTQTFYSNGKEKTRIEYAPKGKHEYKEFYPSGALKVKGNYKPYYGETKTGTWEYYDENGKLTRSESFDQ